jgi:catechol 2,3-dioxygenase-like lactoylglutathione lyase family enzyme
LNIRESIMPFLLLVVLAGCAAGPTSMPASAAEPAQHGSLSFGHVALTVSNVEVSTRWYRDTLGFTLLQSVYDIHVDASPLGKVAAALFGQGLRRLKIAQLQAPGGMRIELFEFVEPRPAIGPPNPMMGLLHLAVVTERFDDTVRKLETSGARRIVTNYANPDRRVAFYADPDGNVLEIDASPWPTALPIP